MKPLLISGIALSLISCNYEKSYEHKTYGEFSIGITKDSLVKLDRRLLNEKLKFYSTVRREGIILPYFINKRDDGKYFNLYPAISTKEGIVSETMFFLSHYTFNTIDEIKDAKPNKMASYPLLSKQQIADDEKDLLGHEDIRKLIEQNLKAKYGSPIRIDSIPFTDFNGTNVTKTIYNWEDIDGFMNIDFVIWETDKYCYECTDFLNPVEPKNQKLYSRAKMYLTYYLNSEAMETVKEKKKNEF